MREERQRNVLWAWETAINKTGGYFYSRLLLMIINGVIVFAALLLVGCPFAFPLALFEAFVTEFIPVVGTYLGGAIPPVVVLAGNGLHQAIIILVVLVIYQQIENPVLSPVLSRRTIELNPGIAFGSVVAGGMLAGAMGAFLALPAAAVIQAFFTTYVKRYDLVGAEAAHVEAGEAGSGGDAASKPP
jgi:predicted PurR-regulated permease PerM